MTFNSTVFKQSTPFNSSNNNIKLLFTNTKSHVLNPFNTQLWKETINILVYFKTRKLDCGKEIAMGKVFLWNWRSFISAIVAKKKSSRHRLEARIVITSREINLKLQSCPHHACPINLTLCSLQLCRISTKQNKKKLTWKTSLLTRIPGLEWLSYLLQLLWLSQLKRLSLSLFFFWKFNLVVHFHVE